MSLWSTLISLLSVPKGLCRWGKGEGGGHLSPSSKMGYSPECLISVFLSRLQLVNVGWIRAEEYHQILAEKSA